MLISEQLKDPGIMSLVLPVGCHLMKAYSKSLPNTILPNGIGHLRQISMNTLLLLIAGERQLV